MLDNAYPVCYKFQSTLPVGGATNVGKLVPILCEISIHAPRGGSDFQTFAYCSRYILFQSTLPVGGATLNDSSAVFGYQISIHAPRGGSDRKNSFQINP